MKITILSKISVLINGLKTQIMTIVSRIFRQKMWPLMRKKMLKRAIRLRNILKINKCLKISQNALI